MKTSDVNTWTLLNIVNRVDMYLHTDYITTQRNKRDKSVKLVVSHNKEDKA